MSIKNSYILVASLLLLLVGSALPVRADDTPSASSTPEASETPALSPQASAADNALLREAQKKEQEEQNRLTRIKTQADKWINERLTVISRLSATISSSKDATSDQAKTALANLTADTASLTSLKTQIDAVTDINQIEALLKQVKTIFTNYRIYEVEIPRDHGLLHLGILNRLNTNFSVVEQNMQADLTYAQGQSGINIVTLTADNTKFKADLATFNADLQKAQATLNSLTPASYPGNKNLVGQLKAEFSTLHTDTQAIHTDYKQFVTDFKTDFKL